MYLIDDYSAPFAGTEGQLLALIEGLIRTGLRPEITLFRESDYINKNGFPCKVRVFKIKRLLSLHALKQIIKFALYLRRNNYKLVHIFFNDASIIAPVILKLFKCKVIISRRDMGYWYTPLNRMILKLNRFFIDAVIVNSEAVKRVTHKNERIPLSKIHVIYNGYNPDRLSSAPSIQNKIIFNRDGKSKVVGMVGNIRPIKRYDDLIRAFALVQKEFPASELIIVGSGDTDKLETLVNELNLTDDVFFLGRQSDIPSIVKKFDVAVLCSESEGFSNSIIEYMRCLVPVVCNDVGGNSEIVEHNVTGYLVEPFNIEELADKICMMLRHPEEARRMAKKADAFVSELCDYDKMINTHLAVYESI